jgi:hypothetical protein
MSGYTADVISDRGVLDESVHFIQKPFTIAALAAKIRDVLDGRVPAARLTELARALREDRQRSRDPGLDDLVEQVELRAEVELAKLQSR